MPPPNQPLDYNLLELFKQKRPLVDILDDPTALFVLAFVNEIGETTRAGLQGELALTADEFAQIIANLNRAELIGTQVDKLYVTAGGREFLDNLGLVGGVLPPPTNAGSPAPTGTPGWLWGLIAFLTTGAVALIIAIVAIIALLPGSSPQPTSVAQIQIDFSADRTDLFAGECTMLNWEVHAAEWVELNGQRVAPIDRMQACPEKSTAYALVAGGGIGARRDLTINVQARPVPPTPNPPPTSAPTFVPPPTTVPTLVPSPTRVPPTPLPGALKGIITRAADGSPIYKAVVQMSGILTTTGDNGVYSFSTLAPGNYAVSVSAPGYFDQQNTATVASGQTATSNFSLIKAPANQGTNVTLQNFECFDFESGKIVPSSTSKECTTPSGFDILWYPGLHAVSKTLVDFAIPQTNAFESCSKITQQSLQITADQYICVLTSQNQIAVIHVTKVIQLKGGPLTFDWWLYTNP